MRSLLSFCSLALALQAGELRYEISGQLAPPASGSVYLHGATTPFHASTQTGSRGQFRFRDVAAGTYTLIAFAGAHGESRQTIEVGPSFADSKRRIKVTCELGDKDVKRGNVVSARELAIPERAWREYSDAQRKLSRHDVAGAIGHLERAVEVAPQFTAAWNHLGTIAYQSREYEKAEAHFRRALAADSDSFEPLVNLGGVLLTLGKIDDALDYNRRAVLARPGDALANSQLGMTYFSAGNFDLARKYLETAKRIDPAHFSHPQLVLAEIHRRRGDGDSASRELDDFVRRHPDSAQATRIRAMRKGSQ